jgi:Domain of unknown function (DUF4884)
MHKYLPLLLIPAFASCAMVQPLPLAVEPSQNNASYTVEYLFEHEGCKVYRFYDRGRYIYFTNCNGEAIATTDSTSTKNTTKVTLKVPSNSTPG